MIPGQFQMFKKYSSFLTWQFVTKLHEMTFCKINHAQIVFLFSFFFFASRTSNDLSTRKVEIYFQMCLQGL